MTYFGFLARFLVVPLAIVATLLLIATRLQGKKLPPEFRTWPAGWVIFGHVVVAILYTTPWDNYLVATSVWWYDPQLVTGIVLGYVPLEEYTFFILQTILTGLWIIWLMISFSGLRPQTPFSPRPNLRRWSTTGLGLIWLISTAVLISGWEPATYLTLILSWALLPVMLQVGFGGDILWHYRRLALIGLGVPSLYLGAADALAIAAGTWTISPDQTVGILLANILPLEEFTFFLLTNVLVTCGIILVMARESHRRTIFFSNLFHPERYHGTGRSAPFFEGWYFKLVDASETNRLAIIPAIFKHETADQNHAFIQILDGLNGQATYHRFPASAFHTPPDSFQLSLDNNRFSTDGLALQIEDEQLSIHGRVTFENQFPWPVSWRSLGVMGPYGWIPFMECNHGVLSMDHTLKGGLTINGRHIDFTGGRGYLEKDWGASFPAAYVWMQSNHFDVPQTSFFGSIAIVPWINSAFPGFIIGLLHQGNLIRLATYTGARTIGLEFKDQQVLWVVEDRHHRLELAAHRAEGGLLYGPNRNSMTERIGETMKSTIDIHLTNRHQNGPDKTIFKGTGRCAGLEIHGDLEQLLALQKQAN